MNLSNVLATAFTLILFTFLVVTYYDQLDVEAFRQYKGIIFAGSMFIFLAIFGLPYMQYDVAQNAPSFTFVSTAIGILALLCALFVYVFNGEFDTFVGGVSTFVILLTIVSRISGSGPSDTFSPFAKTLLQFVVAASVLFGTSKGAEKALNKGLGSPTVQSILSIWTQIAPIGLWGMLIYAIVKAIQGLLSYRLENRPCPGPTPTPYFESFQNTSTSTTSATNATNTSPSSSSSPSSSLLTNLQAAIDRVQNTLEALVEVTDSTCAIVNEVEQGYIGARMAPEDESEYKLPDAEQQRRKQTRQERAKKAFDTNRKIYAATRETVPLECFQDAAAAAAVLSDVSEYEVSLREHCIQLHTLLENAETQAQIRKVQSIEADLEFANRQINKSEGFQNAPGVAESPTHIYTSLRGEALEAAAKALLAKELNLHNKVLQLQQRTQQVRGRMGKTYQKINMVATGNYQV